MQRVLAKYGLAAHLAILAVAPLFLFPFLADATLAVVMLWLTLLAVLWVIASPSVHPNESLHEARERGWRHIRRDPLAFGLLLLVVAAGVVALNTGVAKAYDPESATWLLASAKVAWLPGSVGESGRLPFAAALAFAVIVLAVRHALGGSARMALLLLITLLSGLAALLTLIYAHCGNLGLRTAMECGIRQAHQVGLAYAVGILGGIVALVAVYERKWMPLAPLFVLALGGNLAGGFAFSSALLMLIFAVVAVVLLGYAFYFMHRAAGQNYEFRYLSIVAIAIAVGCLLTYLLVPGEVVVAKLNAFSPHGLLGEDFLKPRAVLSDIALRSWRAHTWLGTGCGSMRLVIEFGATDSDWLLIPTGIASIPNGWLRQLVEAGIAGVVVMLLPIGMLGYTFVRRLLKKFSTKSPMHPAVWLAAVAMVTMLAVGFFDFSPFRAEVVVMFGAMCAISVNSVPTDRR